MIKLKKVKRNQISLLRDLNFKSLGFNKLNEDFFDIYDSLNIIEKFIFKRNVRFIISKESLSGYVWFNSIDKGSYYINSIYLNNDFISGFKESDFKLFLLENKINTIICSSDGINPFKNFLNSLGFTPYDESVELTYDIDKFSDENYNSILEVEYFKENIHEEIRCDIQNSVFHNQNRIPLTLKDIYMEEEQDYYINGAGIFIKKDTEYIGYGQIINKDGFATIVNVGVLEDYRGNGYSKFLINKLLSKGKDLGFETIKIKTNKNNLVALNLYKTMGFIENGDIILWSYDREDKS